MAWFSNTGQFQTELPALADEVFSESDIMACLYAMQMPSGKINAETSVFKFLQMLV